MEEDELKAICIRLYYSQYNISYDTIFYSRYINDYEKLILSILLYHYDSYDKDDNEFCKYSYDYVLGLTRGIFTKDIQDWMIDKLIKLKLVNVKYYKNRISKFRPNINKVNILLRDSEQEMTDEFEMKGRYAIPAKQPKKVIYKTYIIKDEHTHLLKIGRSKDISKRYKTLQSTAPLLKLIMKSENDCEKILREKFKDKRVRGEWFKLEKSALDLLLSEFNFKSCEDEESK